MMDSIRPNKRKSLKRLRHKERYAFTRTELYAVRPAPLLANLVSNLLIYVCFLHRKSSDIAPEPLCQVAGSLNFTESRLKLLQKSACHCWQAVAGSVPVTRHLIPTANRYPSSFLASSTPGAGRPYSLAVTRLRATRCRQRKAGRTAANSSLTVR